MPMPIMIVVGWPFSLGRMPSAGKCWYSGRPNVCRHVETRLSGLLAYAYHDCGRVAIFSW